MNQFLKSLTDQGNVILREAKELIEGGQTVSMVMPFWLQMPDYSWWRLPYEPLVAVQAENVIVKRNVAKSGSRGTIKERWAEGDVKITIEGTFINTDLNKYPDVEVQKLRSALTQPQAIPVYNELLSQLNVTQIVVESFSLPFTKGENVQNYSITALSDDCYDLFIDVK